MPLAMPTLDGKNNLSEKHTTQYSPLLHYKTCIRKQAEDWSNE